MSDNDKPLRKGRIAAVAGSVLLVAALVAGVGYTVVTVRDADRDAGAPVWKLPAAGKAGDTKAAHASGLAGMLVPYDTDGWVRGPDLGEFGSDVSLSGAQAAALRRESLSDLPRSQRRKLEKQFDKLRVKGMAMRSYLSAAGTGGNDEAVTLSIVLSQMGSEAAVRNMATVQSEFLEALDIFRKGPEIKGHDNAKCFLPPKDADTELDTMFCSAYVGDVLVTATADGEKPLDTKEVAVLLRTQLDRIAEPGEAV
ncbi:hypothetical protein IM697_02970 [Streptomyces ferrugineus]|uniref:Secreted protein n=1 Tax=Streptomyces ferrugineus TaxID=1413221 RepID=A0A7M2SM09_9ACTN|nr:hypothetical protein [Streptomyces ferrugineus]QOV37417.1 hypothetical protein IM697_02970 [Streptomyces ferrugineus]